MILQLPAGLIGFGLVGALGFAVDGGLLMLLTKVGGIEIYLSRAVSFVIATIVTWWLNRTLVFHTPNSSARFLSKKTQYSLYLGVQSMGALANLVVFAYLVESYQTMRYYPILPLAFGSAVGLVINFSAARQWVFQLNRNGPKNHWLAVMMKRDQEIVDNTIITKKTFYHSAIHLFSGLAVLSIFIQRYLAVAPKTTEPPSLWYLWWDQSWYLKSALALSRGDFSPGEHWYFPGYPLLGAISAALIQIDPFVIPNIVCLLVSLYCFLEIAKTLGMSMFLASMAFLSATVIHPLSAAVWIEPWSSTPVVALALSCMLAAIRFSEQPSIKTALLCGLFGGFATFVRPSDALILIASLTVLMAIALHRKSASFAGISKFLLAGLGGYLIAALPLVTIYLVIWGRQTSAYMETSSLIGFEPRLLMLRWVNIFIDPRPFLQEGTGLSAAIPWVIPGFFGIFVVLWMQKKQRLCHMMVVLPTLLISAAYLCYRDLNQPALWLNHNYHYFKLLLLVLSLYAFFVVQCIIKGTPARVLSGAALAVACMFFWRINLVAIEAPLMVSDSDVAGKNQIMLSRGLDRVDSVYIVSPGVARIGSLMSLNTELSRSIAEGRNDPLSLFRSPISFKQGDQELKYPRDLISIAREGGILVQPLRQAPHGPVRLSIDTALKEENWTVLPLKQNLTPGVPCWLMPSSCTSFDFVDPPVLALNTEVQFNTAEIEAFTIRGFSLRENWGIWSDGSTAVFRTRLGSQAGKSDHLLTVTLSGFPSRLPGGIQPVELFANDLPVAKWIVSAETNKYTATIPFTAFSKGDILTLRFEMEAPTRPIEIGMSTDIRKLGIGFHSIKIGL